MLASVFVYRKIAPRKPLKKRQSSKKLVASTPRQMAEQKTEGKMAGTILPCIGNDLDCGLEFSYESNKVIRS